MNLPGFVAEDDQLHKLQERANIAPLFSNTYELVAAQTPSFDTHAKTPGCAPLQELLTPLFPSAPSQRGQKHGSRERNSKASRADRRPPLKRGK